MCDCGNQQQQYTCKVGEQPSRFFLSKSVWNIAAATRRCCPCEKDAGGYILLICVWTQTYLKHAPACYPNFIALCYLLKPKNSSTARYHLLPQRCVQDIKCINFIFQVPIKQDFSTCIIIESTVSHNLTSTHFPKKWISNYYSHVERMTAKFLWYDGWMRFRPLYCGRCLARSDHTRY